MRDPIPAAASAAGGGGEGKAIAAGQKPRFIGTFGSKGRGENRFDNPGCLAVTHDNVLVVGDVRVSLFDRDLTFLDEFQPAVPGSGIH